MSPHGFPDLLLSLFEQLVEQLRVKVVDWQMHPSHAKVLSNQQLGQRILVIEFDPRRCTGFGVGGGQGANVGRVLPRRFLAHTGRQFDRLLAVAVFVPL